MDERATRARDLLARHEHRAAWEELSRLMMEAPTTATCHLVADLSQGIDAASAGVTVSRLALLSNYTAQPLQPILQAQAVLSGVQLHVLVPAFDTWMQELLDPASTLRAFAPDLVVLDLVGDAACPALYESFLSLSSADRGEVISRTGELVESAIEALRAWSSARVLIHAFERVVSPTLGILDAGEGSQRHAIGELNQALARIASDRGDVSIVDVDRLVGELGRSHWRDQRMWLMARIPYTNAAMHRIAAEHLRHVRALTGRARKLLVLDLDDTLWGGVLGEVGADQISLGPTYPGNAFVDLQKAVMDLQRRGVILALNSANDEGEAVRVMDSHPAMVLRSRAFAAVRINWQDKAQNLVELSEELGIALDACVFVDNSAAECARVRQALPEVLTVHLEGEPAGFAPRIRQLGVFDTLSYTAEDRQRTSFYRSEAQRGALRRSVSSLDDYLASLESELTIEPVVPATAARAADLTQRTNQFNMTTRRRTKDELLSAVSLPGHEAYVFSLADRFGDHGIIGVMTFEPADEGAVRIADFLVSCRVLKRRIEVEMLRFAISRAHQRGASRVIGEYRPTRRNLPFADFYTANGFQPLVQGADERTFVAPTNAVLDEATHVRVVRRAAVSATA
ncbi:MAG: HAD-IIIC family phosphatase [Acidobacteriota bacterium]